MISNLGEDEKKRVKAIFSEFLDIEEQKRQLLDSQKDLKEEVSQILSLKKGLVSKLFSFLKKKYENGENELEQIYEVVEQLGA